MEASNPLAELKDIHLPAEPSMFPLAIGWYILLAILICIAVVIAILYFLKQAKQKRFLHVDSLICEIEQNNELNDTQIIEQTSLILKRVCLLKFTNDNPQYISGQEWLDYLQQKTPKLNLTTSELRYLANIYQKQQINDKAKLFNDVRNWVRSII